MEERLKQLPLRAVPDDYADRVTRHIARAESRPARMANLLIASQIAVTGILAFLAAWMQSGEMISLFDSILESLNGATNALEQSGSAAVNALANLPIEPLDSLAPYEWLTLAIIAGIIWLFANGLLIANIRKENRA